MNEALDFTKYRIGYSGINDDWTATQDRRRFMFWAKERGVVPLPADPNKDYDLVVVTSSSNMTGWIDWGRRGGKIIFDYGDDYINLPRLNSYNYTVGLFRYLKKRESRLHFNMAATTQALLSQCSGVMLANPGLKSSVGRFCPRVEVVTDNMGELSPVSKSDYRRTGALNLVWDGMTMNLDTLGALAEPLREYKGEVCFHIISDRERCYFLTKMEPSIKFMARTLPGANWRYYEWDIATVGALIRLCDVAVIPLPKDNLQVWNKPANKLLGYWNIGMPVLTSDTPAYKAEMARAGLDGTCGDTNEWITKLARMAEDDAYRQHSGESAREYVARTYTKESRLALWDGIIGEVLRETRTPH